MGRCQFGARVVYGDCLMITISPNEQHSAMVLRLSRFRAEDPLLQHRSPEWKQLAGKDYPLLEQPREQQQKEEEVIIDLPEYDLRRAATARDPHAVVEGYKTEILLRLAWLNGVRMCPDCPRCNYGDNFTPCQDKFGNNMRPMGGSAGGMNAIGGGTEHQAVGTPHLHAQGHVVCMYQYDTLQEVADRIRAGFVNYQSVVDYQSWFHREEVMDLKEHEAYADQAED